MYCNKSSRIVTDKKKKKLEITFSKHRLHIYIYIIQF